MRRFPPVLLVVNAVLWAPTLYIVGKPLLQSRAGRGDYLFGYYALREIYIGFPLLCVTLVATAILLCPPARRRAIGLRVGGLVFSVLFALALFDLVYAFGLVGAWKADYWLDQGHVSRLDNVADAELGFARKPNLSWRGSIPGSDHVVHYTTDDQGFRNLERPERADVVFIGDSYTEAAQIDLENIFVNKVAARSKRTVVNLGRGAYGPQQELVVLQRHGLGYEPKQIVWQLFEGNDLNDAHNFEAWKSGASPPSVGLLDRYMRNSLFNPILTRTLVNKRGNYVRLDCGDGSDIAMRMRYRWRTDLVDVYPDAWEATKAALSEGLELCRSRGIELVVLFIPVQARVNAERLRFDDPKDRAKYLPESYDAQPGFAPQLVAYCKEIGCPLIDVHASFVTAASDDPRGIYIPTDEHLDVRGHELVADLVVEWLAK